MRDHRNTFVILDIQCGGVDSLQWYPWTLADVVAGNDKDVLHFLKE